MNTRTLLMGRATKGSHTRRRRAVPALPVAAGCAAVIVPLFLPPYWLSILILGVIFSILAVGLNLLMGYAGLESLGQAAFFGTAAYILGLLTSGDVLSWVPAALLGLTGASLVAALFGLVAVRLRGLYFLLITVALGQVLWGASLRLGDLTGGWNGLGGVALPFDALSEPILFYYFALAFLSLIGGGLYKLIHSPFGLILRGIRERELRSKTLGFKTYVHSYLAFVIAGAIAAVAGLLNASYNGFVSPRDLSLELSFDAMLMVILGGTGTLAGPIIGAFVVTALRYLLSVYIREYWLIVLGLVFIGVTVWLPSGLIGLGNRRRARIDPDPGASERGGDGERPSVAPAGNDGAVQIGVRSWQPDVSLGDRALEVVEVHKSFGDVAVLRDVDLLVERGERLGIIGLNGAGKTTLFQVISGLEAPTAGRINILGDDVTRLSPDRRSSAGLARTFQVTMLYPRLTVGDNVAMGMLGRRFRNYQYIMWRRLNGLEDIRGAVSQLLSDFGLAELADEEVRFLSYGHQRQVEIAVALASEPSLLLLDEPTAGLSQADMPAMLSLLKALPPGLTILIVEHNLELIFELVQRVVVLHEGQVIMDGSPRAVRQDAEVQRLYFGSGLTAGRASTASPTPVTDVREK
jgi:branched-chain amino acid transport system ATP-binding protein